jgi:hypothetical protein
VPWLPFPFLGATPVIATSSPLVIPRWGVSVSPLERTKPLPLDDVGEVQARSPQ